MRSTWCSSTNANIKRPSHSCCKDCPLTRKRPAPSRSAAPAANPRANSWWPRARRPSAAGTIRSSTITNSRCIRLTFQPFSSIGTSPRTPSTSILSKRVVTQSAASGAKMAGAGKKVTRSRILYIGQGQIGRSAGSSPRSACGRMRRSAASRGTKPMRTRASAAKGCPTNLSGKSQPLGIRSPKRSGAMPGVTKHLNPSAPMRRTCIGERPRWEDSRPATAPLDCTMRQGTSGNGPHPTFKVIRASAPIRIRSTQKCGSTAITASRAAVRGSAPRTCCVRAFAISTGARSAQPSSGCAARAMPDDATLASAIARYHELCNDPQLAGPGVVESFARAQADAGLTFGGVIQCRSLRPAFTTPARLQLLRDAVATMWRTFAEIERRALGDAALAGELGLSAAERELIAIEPGYADATVVSRLDTYFAEKPRVLEYNADSPAGMSYQAGQAALMRELPVFQRFSEEYETATLRADVALRETLLGVWREFCERRGIGERLPQVAIVDLDDAATTAEFQIVKRDFETHGVTATIASPEALRFAAGKLWAGEMAVDLVYKRLLVADFLARYDRSHPLVQAYAAGSVCVASSFRCTIAHKKRALAALLDPRHAPWFSAPQRAAIQALVPRTRPLGDALPERLSNVLKPNDSHGGEGITLGSECSEQAWLAAVARAREGDYVVQERVTPTRGVYP